MKFSKQLWDAVEGDAKYPLNVYDSASCKPQ